MLDRNPSFGLRRQQSEARRSKETVKLHLEILEDRTVPSVTNPLGNESVSAVNSLLISALDQQAQRVEAVEQAFISDMKTLVQNIYQEVAALEQKWLNL